VQKYCLTHTRSAKRSAVDNNFGKLITNGNRKCRDQATTTAVKGVENAGRGNWKLWSSWKKENQPCTPEETMYFIKSF